jgi:hypothetical protein
MEHLAFEELHSPFSEGGLRLSTIDTRAQALAKQACHRLAAPTSPIGWASASGTTCTPLGGGPHTKDIPLVFKELATLLLEVFSLPEVSVASLSDVTSKYMYSQFTSSLPPLKVECLQPDIPWCIAWARLACPSLSAAAADVMFSLLHYIPPMQTCCQCL